MAATILIVAEHDGIRLNSSTARCVACARRIADASITIAVLSAQGASIAAEAAALEGVQRVLQVDHAANAHLLASTLAPQIVALAGSFSHVFAPSTTFGKDVLPRVAALLGAPQVSDIMAVEGERRFRRPVYAGNAILTVDVAPEHKVIATVRGASFEPVKAGSQAAPIETIATASAPSSDRPDLQTASRVVSGGRALGSADSFKLLYSLADKLGAAVGASRAAVDAGYAANDLQVGQTGKIIAPQLYIAIGISGAIQHLTGIKDARTIVAINKDAEAPIFEIADIGLVGDLFTVLPELEKLLAS
jgi:electron transfer flavoprotein alpha subunit